MRQHGLVSWGMRWLPHGSRRLFYPVRTPLKPPLGRTSPSGGFSFLDEPLDPGDFGSPVFRGKVQQLDHQLPDGMRVNA